MRSFRSHCLTSCLVIFCIAASVADLFGSAASAVGESPFHQQTAELAPPSEAYRIATGDLVSIAVWGQEQFSQDCQVNGAGTISYPLLGDIRAAGLTCLELQAQLENGLEKYLKRPRVLVKVVEYGQAGTSVFVIGEVNAPNAYPFSHSMGLMQVIAAAGGPTSRASDEITVVKAGTGEIRTVGMEEILAESQVSDRTNLQPGDVVVVNRKDDTGRQRRYAVLGEIPKPGRYPIPTGETVTVLDAMEKAGLLATESDAGTDSSNASASGEGTADLEHALLTRGDVIVPLDLRALLQGDMSQNLLLQDGDVLTVPQHSLIAVYALGEVHRQGRQDLGSGSSLVALLNAAGGVTSSANLGQATVLRSAEEEPTSIQVDLGALLRHADAEQNISLQDGDVLFVPSKGEKKAGLSHLLPIIPYLLN